MWIPHCGSNIATKSQKSNKQEIDTTTVFCLSEKIVSKTMNDGHLAGLNKETITSSDISRLEALFYENVHLEELYKVRNDAKLRAVLSTKSYDEFKNIVDAAHLRPITKHDKTNADTRNRLWNTSVKDK